MKVVYSLISILCAVVLNAQTEKTGNLKGKTIDFKTQHPLPFVEIKTENAEFGCISDVNGIFMLSNIPAGRYIVSAKSPGYSN